ncbi:hypothetical protein CP533_2240 [Ophiocordyceps camponoti-saundersi (nom. inval.)]|nr:hypothetical protein CP533_2240 [Ophiocordyceps camponoti-saundersi (nom. inval.)]
MAFFPDAFSSFTSAPSSHHRHNRHHHATSTSSSRRRHRSRSGSRPRSSSGKIFNLTNSSRSSLFGLGNASRSSLFGLGASRSSYYKRSPRRGFFQRSYRQLRRILRDLIRYAKRHPWKVFFLVVMPLLTGGALSALLARFGLRIPPYVENLLGIASHAASADSIGLVSDAVRFAGQFRSAADGRRWDRPDRFGDFF